MSGTAKYKIIHRTTYRYSEPVALCQNQVRMLPRDVDCPWVTVRASHAAISIHPSPDSVVNFTDYFGNEVYAFSIESSHETLIVDVDSKVEVSQPHRDAGHVREPWGEVVNRLNQKTVPDWIDIVEFSGDSNRVKASQQFAEYALHSFTPRRSIWDAALELTQRITDDFRYDSQATSVNTTPEQAFKMGAGVCQDFAHILIASLRSIGVPARYVSGYLRTEAPPGKEKLIGADQSHAWVGIYCGPELGWVDFDPTNRCATGLDHIPICFGRDYSDVVPMQGVVTGGGSHSLSVNVNVEELN